MIETKQDAVLVTYIIAFDKREMENFGSIIANCALATAGGANDQPNVSAFKFLVDLWYAVRHSACRSIHGHAH